MKNKKVELLAPAKNLECAVSAINYGADAVYIGANSFGARQNATNNLDDIKQLVDYAHKFYVKVFCTVNTILDDKELLKAKELIENLYKIGVDAIIIQDMGLLKLDLPPIPLHASTQCDNRNLEKVKFYEEVGLERVILARETSLKEIENICKNTNVEIETFIHGALCVSYSGQCYLSEYIGNRSANRGCCAQPCRKKYTLMDEDGKVTKEVKNATKMVHPITKVEIVVKPKATSYESALSLARGLSASVLHFDEPEFTPFIDVIVENSVSTFNTSAENAKNAGAVYGRVFTLTAA